MTALVTNNGLSGLIAAWISAASLQYIQGGTGSGQDATDNDVAAAAQSRVAGTLTQQTVNVAGDTLNVSGVLTAVSDITISEVGLFDATTGGAMGMYGDFAGIALATGDALAFSISITAS